MRAKSVKQLLDEAAHVEKWYDGIGWVAVSYMHDGVIKYRRRVSARLMAGLGYRIVTVKGKAIA